MNLNEILKPGSFPKFFYILCFQNRDLSRWSLTSETVLLSSVLRHWCLQICRKGRHKSSLVNNSTFSAHFLVIYAEEPSPYISSASEVSLPESEVTGWAGPLFCICEDKFGGPQHVGLSVFSAHLPKLLPLSAHSAETSFDISFPMKPLFSKTVIEKRGRQNCQSQRSVELEAG